jgi:phosphoribosylglycinamide formyltransferase 1
LNKRLRKWILLGPGNGKKPQIVMQCLLSNPVIKKRPFIFIPDSETGCAVDYALQNGLQVSPLNDPYFETPEATSLIDSIDADLLVSCGWNYLIPESVLGSFRFPPINCHGSVLPDYKGQRSYMHQWANCEEEYGASIHVMDEKLDEGRLLLQGRMKLYAKESLEIMHRRMSELTGVLLPQALLLIEAGYEGVSFDPAVKSRYFYKITPARAKMHRLCNRVLKLIHGPLWMTPHDGS